MRSRFLENLISALIEANIIKHGITIPYLIGAYKIKDKTKSKVSKEYIQQVFNTILHNEKKMFFIRECTNVSNHKTICMIDIPKDKDIIDDVQYKRICNSQNSPILFFETEFEELSPTIENISQLFWDRYRDTCFLNDKFSFEHSRWIKIPKKEEKLIKKVIKNMKP